MSLGKLKELEDLKAANTKLGNELDANNDRVIKEAIQRLRKDFRAHFEANNFTVTANSSAFVSSGQGSLDASYGNMKATLAQSYDADSYFTIDSNINSGIREYNIGVYTSYPDSIKSTPSPNPFKTFKSEDEELSYNIEQAQELLERLKLKSAVQDEVKYSFGVSWKNDKLNKQYRTTSDDFAAILAELFK